MIIDKTIWNLIFLDFTCLFIKDMRHESCRKCGRNLFVEKYCQSCKISVQLICKVCNRSTDEQIHLPCPQPLLFHENQIFDTRDSSRVLLVSKSWKLEHKWWFRSALDYVLESGLILSQTKRGTNLEWNGAHSVPIF